MKYLHQKMKEAILDRKKVSIENQAYLVEGFEVSSFCSLDCFLIFSLILLMIGIN